MRTRRATLADVDFMAGQPARDFCAMTSPGVDIYDATRVRALLTMLVEMHFVVLAETPSGEIAGGLGALVHPHVWNPALRCATECFWWVDQGYRGSRAAHSLLRAYSDFIEREGIVKGALCLLEGSPVSDRVISRMGFAPREHTYIKEMAHA